MVVVGVVVLALVLLAAVGMGFGFWRGWPKRSPDQPGREPTGTRTVLHYLADASGERRPAERRTSSTDEKTPD